MRKQKNYRNFAELASHSPLIQDWGIQCVQEGAGHSVLRLLIRPVHLNSIGTVHGGVIAGLADTACGIAYLSVAPKDAGYVTANLNVNYLGIPKGEFLEAHAKVVSSRKRVAFVAVDIFDDRREQVATATVLFSVLA